MNENMYNCNLIGIIRNVDHVRFPPSDIGYCYLFFLLYISPDCEY